MKLKENMQMPDFVYLSPYEQDEKGGYSIFALLRLYILPFGFARLCTAH